MRTKRIWGFAALLWLMGFAMAFGGCGDTIVEPADITIDNTISASPIDGHWVGTMRDDAVVTWYAGWHIGVDGSKRILSGDILVTDHAASNTQSFPIQHTDDNGIIVHEDLSWQALVYMTSLWDVRGRLVHADTMEVTVRGHNNIGGVTIYKLHRATNWPGKN